MVVFGGNSGASVDDVLNGSYEMGSESIPLQLRLWAVKSNNGLTIAEASL
jgi:hypothetical protein